MPVSRDAGNTVGSLFLWCPHYSDCLASFITLMGRENCPPTVMSFLSSLLALLFHLPPLVFLLINYYMQEIWVLWPRLSVRPNGVGREKGVGDFCAGVAVRAVTDRPWISPLPLCIPSILIHSMRHLGRMPWTVPFCSDTPRSALNSLC